MFVLIVYLFIYLFTLYLITPNPLPKLREGKEVSINSF